MLSRAPFVTDVIHIVPLAEVCLLGVLLDKSLSLKGHISNVTWISFHQLQKIRMIHRYLLTSAVIQLVLIVAQTRIDYCNSILLGLPNSQLSRLQMVFNASAHMIFGARWDEHVTPSLKNKLHWLHIPERIIYKRCWLTFLALNDLA